MKIAVLINGITKPNPETCRNNLSSLIDNLGVDRSLIDVYYNSYMDAASASVISENKDIDFSFCINESKINDKYLRPILERSTIQDWFWASSIGHLKMFFRNKYTTDIISKMGGYSHILYVRPDLKLEINISGLLDSNNYIIPRPRVGEQNHFDHAGFGKADIVFKAWDFGEDVLKYVKDYSLSGTRQPYAPESILFDIIANNGVPVEYVEAKTYNLIR